MISFEMKQIPSDNKEKVLKNKETDFLLNDFAFTDSRNEGNGPNDFQIFSGRSNGIIRKQPMVKNDREEINLDELNALLGEGDGVKFEDKFN